MTVVRVDGWLLIAGAVFIVAALVWHRNRRVMAVLDLIAEFCIVFCIALLIVSMRLRDLLELVGLAVLLWGTYTLARRAIRRRRRD